MPANRLVFKDAEKARDAVTKAQQRQIAELYKKWANEIGKKAEEYAHKGTPSAPLMQRQLEELQKAVRKAGMITTQNVTNNIQMNMYTTANTVVEANEEWLKSVGFDSRGVAAAFGNVPMDIVQNLATGNVYEGGWNLSKAIWGSNEQTMKDLYEVAAAGVAQNMSIYEIAKLMEQYVDPSAAKPWNLKSADGRPIYKKQVDYNAQRLARTLVQHTYQQSFQATTKDNPFIKDYIWRSNGSRVCPLCKARDGKHFPKGKLPLDHPNGMCTMVPNMDSMDDIANQLAAWTKAPDGKYPGIDKFAKKLGFTFGSPSVQTGGAEIPTQKVVASGSEFAAKYGTSSGAKFNYWYTKLDPEAKAIAKQLKEQSGQTWQEWYEANIYKSKSGKPVAKVAQPTSSSQDVLGISVSDWIAKVRKQTESHMLAMEADNFANMNSMQVQGLRRYTGSSYEEMNSYLRYRASGKGETMARRLSGLSLSQKSDMLNAISGLKKVSTTQEYTLRRGTDLGDLAGLMQGNFAANKSKLEKMSVKELNDMFAGHTGTYAGFTSTSSIWDRGFTGEVEVVLRAPVGTQGSSVMTISNFGTSEGEFLLNAGTRVQVVKVEKSDGHMDSNIRVYMDIIGNEDLLK